MKTKISRWDTAEVLENEVDINDYLQLAFADGDPQLIITALGNAARAHGMIKLARETGLNRENLYRSLSGDKDPKFLTITKVANSLGYQIAFIPTRDLERNSTTRVPSHRDYKEVKYAQNKL